jgi:hypothetical protein
MSIAMGMALLLGLGPAAHGQTTGTVEGIVRVNGNPLPNALVFALDNLANHQYFTGALTNGNGAYAFTDVPAGELNVQVVAPLGCVATAPAGGQALVEVSEGGVTTLNFELAVIPSAGRARGVSYWKHQATVHHLHRGHAQESESDMQAYIFALYTHFGSGGSAPQSLDLNAAFFGSDVFTLSDVFGIFDSSSRHIYNHSRQEFMALLLNVTSNKLHTLDVISADGATVSQALQHISQLLRESLPDNDNNAVAKDLAETLNSGRQLPAGSINTSLPVIPFAPRLRSASGLARVTPNPMVTSSTLAFELESAGRTSVRVFDVSGRLVRTLADGEMRGGRHSAVWDGRSDAGQAVANGVYFYRVEVRNGSPLTARFVVIGQ